MLSAQRRAQAARSVRYSEDRELRYSEDQPRDEDGRFAGGGADTPEPGPTPEITPDEVAGTNSPAVSANEFQEKAAAGTLSSNL
jgi:hypothetical protein